MATKTDILKEIYQVRNQINSIEGKPLVDLDDKQIQIRIENEAYNGKKYLFEDELKRVYKVLEYTQNEHKVNEFYKIPEGLAFKTVAEDQIRFKKEEWADKEKETKSKVLNLIQSALGSHWGIERFHPTQIVIGVINQEKTTSERQEFFFAQSIDLRYEASSWLKEGKEVFEANKTREYKHGKMY